MKTFTYLTVAVSAVAGAAFGLAASAAAAPSTVGSAQDTVNRLQGLGYNVAVNGSATAPLWQCGVTGVHPDDPESVAAARFTTIWVDVSCPPTNN